MSSSSWPWWSPCASGCSRAAGAAVPPETLRPAAARHAPSPRPAARSDGRARRWAALEGSLGDVGTIAGREIRERVRGRIFRVGTLIILIAVGAAIVIPTLSSGGRSHHPVSGSRRSACRPRPSRSFSRPGRATRTRSRSCQNPRWRRPRQPCAVGKIDFAWSTAMRSCSSSPPARARPRPTPASCRRWPSTSAC